MIINKILAIVITGLMFTSNVSEVLPNIASYKSEYVNMRMEIPKDWDYEFSEAKGYNGSVYAFGLTMWPKESRTTEFKMQYHIRFGLCGTGVTLGELSFDNGLEAISNTEIMYDEGKEYIYYYLVFKDKAGDYVLSYEGLKTGYDEYIDEVLQMVETLVIAEEQLTQPEVTQIAEDYCGIDYEYVHCLFDYVTGEWTVNLYNKDDYKNKRVVYLDNDGNVIEKNE